MSNTAVYSNRTYLVFVIGQIRYWIRSGSLRSRPALFSWPVPNGEFIEFIIDEYNSKVPKFMIEVSSEGLGYQMGINEVSREEAVKFLHKQGLKKKMKDMFND